MEADVRHDATRDLRAGKKKTKKPTEKKKAKDKEKLAAAHEFLSKRAGRPRARARAYHPH